MNESKEERLNVLGDGEGPPPPPPPAPAASPAASSRSRGQMLSLAKALSGMVMICKLAELFISLIKRDEFKYSRIYM